jgi:dTDP-4-amino-4,6-dideoxygalactose transaminase
MVGDFGDEKIYCANNQERLVIMESLFKVFMPDEVSLKIAEIMTSGQLASGIHTKNFEKKLQEYVGNPNILTVSGNSISFALKLLDIKAGDEIIVSPMGCLMTTQPIVYAGATVVWADIDPLTGSLDPIDVKSKITSKTKAIIHYHWAGYPGYIDEINTLAKENGIIVIEDATESFGAEYSGHKIGNNGTDIVCYSFTPVRLPNTIDGGGLAFNNKQLLNKALLMRDLGIDRSKFRDELGELSESCDISTIGDASAMNNVSGFIGASQMDYLDTLYMKQRENAKKWECYFENDNTVTLLKKNNNSIPSYWAFTILSDNRDDLLQEFRRKGFYASKMHIRNDIYSVFQSSAKEFKGINEFSSRELNLPCGWWVKSEGIIK